VHYQVCLIACAVSAVHSGRVRSLAYAHHPGFESWCGWCSGVECFLCFFGGFDDSVKYGCETRGDFSYRFSLGVLVIEVPY
jgi:hypothetical protein